MYPIKELILKEDQLEIVNDTIEYSTLSFLNVFSRFNQIKMAPKDEIHITFLN